MMGAAAIDLARSGGCLCGAVRFDCILSEPTLQACHCVQCQRWTGGGPLIVVHVEKLAIADETTIGRFHASDWGERCFCTKCGSTLYWTMKGRATESVGVGLLDDQSGLTMTHEIFVDHRPDWLPEWPDAAQSTEAQEFAKLEDYLEGENHDTV